MNKEELCHGRIIIRIVKYSYKMTIFRCRFVCVFLQPGAAAAGREVGMGVRVVVAAGGGMRVGVGGGMGGGVCSAGIPVEVEGGCAGRPRLPAVSSLNWGVLQRAPVGLGGALQPERALNPCLMRLVSVLES